MQNSETNISEQSIKRILTQLKKQPVEICSGYSCAKHASVFFIVFKKNSETPIFEISLGTRGRFLYKKNEKFVNPPLFDDLFKTTQNIYTQQVSEQKQPSIADKKILTAQNIILDCFAKHNLFQY